MGQGKKDLRRRVREEKENRMKERGWWEGQVEEMCAVYAQGAAKVREQVLNACRREVALIEENAKLLAEIEDLRIQVSAPPTPQPAAEVKDGSFGEGTAGEKGAVPPADLGAVCGPATEWGGQSVPGVPDGKTPDDSACAQRDSAWGPVADVQAADFPGYTTVGPLGSGQFGTALRVRNSEGDYFCIKVTKVRRGGGTDKMAAAVREAEMLRRMQPHAHIVGLEEVLIQPKQSRVITVLQLATSDLKKWLHCFGKPQLHVGARMLREVAKALVHLHSRRIIHRDVKAANVLVQDDNTTLLSDFGDSIDMENLHTVSGRAGDPELGVPEMIRNVPYDEKVDIWAHGWLQWEVLPCSNDCMQACTTENPHRRPSAEHVAAFYGALDHSAPPCSVPQKAEVGTADTL
eukprot:TRINITY_DN42593_c0_g1_i1.p1 TRINITY_DN42593_c0_g1~~TRINITY_DN42593_c0_g1_i1.p1  ORF type:complete len:404 (+),score=99.64 TRINITY_DN42593_c0_g1_i1:79-1290(+)